MFTPCWEYLLHAHGVWINLKYLQLKGHKALSTACPTRIISHPLCPCPSSKQIIHPLYFPWIKEISFWHVGISDLRIRWSSKMKHDVNESFLSWIVWRGVGRLGEITAGPINHGINYVFSQCCQGFLFANCLQTDWKSPRHIPCLKIFTNFFTV